jgi:hypothetical protein
MAKPPTVRADGLGPSVTNVPEDGHVSRSVILQRALQLVDRDTKSGKPNTPHAHRGRGARKSA